MTLPQEKQRIGMIIFGIDWRIFLRGLEAVGGEVIGSRCSTVVFKSKSLRFGISCPLVLAPRTFFEVEHLKIQETILHRCTFTDIRQHVRDVHRQRRFEQEEEA